jgi:hypothetical protein
MNAVIVPNLLNLVTYLHGTMHMGVTDSATTVTNLVGAMCGFALIGAFLSDSYIMRSTTILLFGPLMFLVISLAFCQLSIDFLLCYKENVLLLHILMMLTRKT